MREAYPPSPPFHHLCMYSRQNDISNMYSVATYKNVSTLWYLIAIDIRMPSS